MRTTIVNDQHLRLSRLLHCATFCTSFSTSACRQGKWKFCWVVGIQIRFWSLQESDLCVASKSDGRTSFQVCGKSFELRKVFLSCWTMNTCSHFDAVSWLPCVLINVTDPTYQPTKAVYLWIAIKYKWISELDLENNVCFWLIVNLLVKMFLKASKCTLMLHLKMKAK